MLKPRFFPSDACADIPLDNVAATSLPTRHDDALLVLLSRLVKVTPTSHGDRGALQESMELIEQGLDTMNQETARDSGTTKLWRRISMINPQGSRRSEHPIDLLGSTTWGVRKMVLETLGWGKESRDTGI